MKKDAYIAIDPKTGRVNMVCLTGPDHAESVAESIKSGEVIERVTAQQARALFGEIVPDSIEL